MRTLGIAELRSGFVTFRIEHPRRTNNFTCFSQVSCSSRASFVNSVEMPWMGMRTLGTNEDRPRTLVSLLREQALLSEQGTK